MSFILDALRKSELERQRQSGPSIAELPAAREVRRFPWALPAIGLLLAVNAGVLLYFILRDDEAPGAAVAATAAPPPAAAAPVATLPAAPLPLPATTEMPPAMQPATTDADAHVAPAMPETSTARPAPDPTLRPGPSVTFTPSAESPPSIDEMPAQATAGMPELSVDLHIYSEDPSKRAVFINGRRYQKGGVLAEGPTVEEINREGVVLSYHGQRFQLSRQ